MSALLRGGAVIWPATAKLLLSDEITETYRLILIRRILCLCPYELSGFSRHTDLLLTCFPRARLVGLKAALKDWWRYIRACKALYWSYIFAAYSRTREMQGMQPLFATH